MNTFSEEFSSMDTPIHRWEPRTKIIGLMILIFSFSFVDRLELMPALVIISAFLFLLSRLPFTLLLQRWRVPIFFIIIMGLFLMFFSSGTVLFRLGPLSIKKEGIHAMILITVRFFCILTVIVTLFETTPFLTILKAMGSLGIPSILTDMTMFTYRYIFEIGDKLRTMMTAMKIRGFKNHSLKDIINLTSLVGTIFVRSYEQSERVYNAIVLRGYGEKENLKNEFITTTKDIVYVITIILISISLICFQLYL